MPCNDGWNNARGCDGTCNLADVKALRTRNDKLAQMLCGLCRQQQGNGLGDLIRKVPGLTEWWKEHQEHDRQREEKERKAKQAERLKDEDQLRKLARKLGKKII